MGSSDGPGAAGQAERSVLRFAVAMRGGVSLAVWIGGAMQEIDHLRLDEDFAHHVLGVTRFNRLQVDIITGASAGGLNAALAGMAIAHGTSLACLRKVWMDTADIDSLLDMPRSRARIRSLLNGEYFRLELVRWLEELKSPGDDHPGGHDCPDEPELDSPAGDDGAVGSPVEIFLAATVFGGVPVVEATDPTFTDRRRQAYFHFRHLAVSPAFSDTCGKPEAAERLGRAARASASFPVAFDPVVLDAAAFSGRLQLPAGAPIPTTLRLFDGGILDNIPVARAIRAAAASPAQEPVRRWVVYLHPSPTLPKPLASETDGSESPHVAKVVADLLAGRGVETLLDDLEVLREHNREAESQRVQRYSACHAAFESLRASGQPPGANLQGDGLASVDADHLFALLADPASMLGWIPIGSVPPASPIEAIEEDACLLIRESFLDRLSAAGGTVRPFARLVRLSHLAIEWIRSVESRGGISRPDLRRTVYDILLVARLVDAALDTAFLETADDRVEGLVDALEKVRRSPALHALAGLVGCAAGPAREPLRERLPTGPAQDTLDLLAAGRLPADPPAAAGPALDEVLLDRLADVGRVLAETGRGLEVREPTSLFRLLEEWLGDAPGVDDVRRHLLALDSACAGLHRGRAVGAPMPLEYVRISGAAGSPLARGSTFPPGVLAQFSELEEVAGRIDPRDKLSGNSLANFSAFLSRRFRANDWMWGRMDAAAGLVDILIRPEHLARETGGGGEGRAAALEGRVEAAVLAPFASVADAAVRRSAELVFERLWADNRSLVHADVNVALTDSGATLDATRQLLTARWQLEIFLAEVPDLLAAPLLPGGAPEPFPTTEMPGDDDLVSASGNIAQVMSAYESAPRGARELWGSRKTTALGVRVARNLSRSLVPGRGVGAVTTRTLASVPIMIATAALLARGAFLVACSLLGNVVLVPRLAPGSLFQWVVLGAGTVVSLLFWAVFVRRRSGRGRWRGWVALGVTLAIQAFGWTVLFWPWLQVRLAPRQVAATAPWDSTVVLGKPLFGAIVVALATALAWFLLLIWAQKAWAIGEAAIIGAVWGWWVIVGAWKPAGHLGVPARLQAALGSMWIPALALVVISAGVTVAVRIEDRGMGSR